MDNRSRTARHTAQGLHPIVPDLFCYILAPMLAMDATPADAARFEYEAVAVYHCQMIVHVPLRMLPARPLREMRFRCERCGAPLTPEEAGAKWTRHADAPGVPNMWQVLPRFEEG